MRAEGRTSRAHLSVREVNTADEFQLLENDWNRLASVVSGSVFLRHEWFSAAWAWRQTSAALQILCVYSADRLVAVLPLLQPQRSPNGVRVVKLLTIPDTQWCDLLVDTAVTVEACAALADHLASTASRWDTLCLERLPPRSEAARLLMPCLEARGIVCRLAAVDCNLFIDLRGVWDKYYASRSRSVKKACNLATNRLHRAGNPQVQQLRDTDFEDGRLQELLAELVSVSARSWKRAPQNWLPMPGPRAFIHELSGFALAQGVLSVWLLRLDGKAIAMEYQIVKDGNVHALRADFDETYRHLSPGTYLNRRIIEELFVAGCDRYYMGPGQNAYKGKWSDTGEPVHELTAYATTMRGRAIRLWSDLKVKLRTLRDAESFG